MIYRLILSFIVLVAFTADYHFAPGGQKFSPDFYSFSLFSLSLFFTWSWILFWDYFGKTQKSLGLIFVPFFMGLMTLVHYYELNSGGKLETSMLLDNFQGVADVQGLKLLKGLFYDNFVAANVFWAILIASFFALSYREKKSRLYLKLFPFRKTLRVLPFVLLIVISLGFHSSFENFAGLFRGLQERVYSRPNRLQALADKIEAPLAKVSISSSEKGHPNVILVFVESLSSYFVESKSPQGQEYLPYFNQLIRRGHYFEKHYSVSVQTARGHFAALCGKIPLYQGLESTDYTQNNFDCLPKYLKPLGYKSVFIQAFGKSNFDSTMDFLKNQGFDEIPQVATTCDKETAGTPCWNWGIQDDEFYKRVFKNLENQPQPLFLSLATITSHMPFLGTPENLIVHYKKPRNRLENYANTLTVVDKGFKVLMEKIQSSAFAQNSILIITGDHGFPMGQHNNFHNENYAFDENFKVPMLVLDLRKNEAKRFLAPTSHLNLPATVLDLAGYQGLTSFQGASLLDEAGVKTQPVYLVQPYSGVMLGSIRWPWKFLFEKKTTREFYYNLEEDPEEKKLLTEADVPPDFLRSLEGDVARIIWNTQNFKKELKR